MSNPSSALPGPAPREPQETIPRYRWWLEGATGLMHCDRHEAGEWVKWSDVDSALQQAQATIREKERDLESARDWMRLDSAFQEWAQGYLDASRWAGHDRSDAIKTELLERDQQLIEAQATIQRLAQERDEWVDAYRSQADALTDARALILPLQALVEQMRKHVKHPDERPDKIWGWRVDEWADQLQEILTRIAPPNP